MRLNQPTLDMECVPIIIQSFAAPTVSEMYTGVVCRDDRKGQCVAAVHSQPGALQEERRRKGTVAAEEKCGSGAGAGRGEGRVTGICEVKGGKGGKSGRGE
jgi:hypothetical protein